MKFTVNNNNTTVTGSDAQRRKFLTGLAALGAGALLPGCESLPLCALARSPHQSSKIEA